MGLEIEAKWPVDEKKAEEIKKILKDKGQFLVKILEENVVLDDENESMFKNGNLLRLRRTVDLETGMEKNILTLKRKVKGKENEEVKVMDETEINFDDFNKMLEVFEFLGYRKKWRYEKIREIWKVFECEVCIDKLPKLGFFVEIEGKSEEEIIEVSKILGLEKAKMIKDNYAKITLEKLKSLEDLVFEK